MDATYYGSYIRNTWRPSIELYGSETDTTFTLETVYMFVNSTDNAWATNPDQTPRGSGSSTYSATLSFTGKSNQARSATWDFWLSFSGMTWTKTHSPQTITVKSTNAKLANYVIETMSGSYTGPFTDTGSVSGTFTIPAKTSYQVYFYENGGTGAPDSQTKWHDETLTLTSDIPVRPGYRFVEWNTNADGSGTSYAPGGSYTANGTLSLYAIWKISFDIMDVSAYLSVADGTHDPIGKMMSVSFAFSSNPDVAISMPTTFDIEVNDPNYVPPEGEAAPAYIEKYTVSNDQFSGSISHVFSGAKYDPTKTYAITITGWANGESVTNGVALLPDEDYEPPTVSISYVGRAVPTMAGSSPDICGEYVKATVSYSVQTTETTDADAKSLTAQFESQSPKSAPSSSLDGSGTNDFLLGPYGAATLTPESSYSVTASVSDEFTTVTATATLPAESTYVRPAYTTVTATRCTSEGDPDICGEYVKVVAGYSMSSTPTQRTPTATVSFSGGAATAMTCDHQESEATALLGPYSAAQLEPESSYQLALAISDRFNASTRAATLPVESDYRRPTVTIFDVVRTTSDGSTEDALGGYLRVRARYTMTETDTQPQPVSSAGVLKEKTGETLESGANAIVAATRYVTHLFGPLTTAEMKPDDYYAVTFNVADRFNSASNTAAVPVSDYTFPRIYEFDAYRIDAQGEESDDGTDMQLDISWSIYSSATQGAPSAFNVRVVSESGEEVVDEDYEYSTTSGSPTSIVLSDPVSEMFSQNIQYTVTVTIADMYSLAALSTVVTSAFFTLDVKRGGHGVAFGKPSTRQVMDVRLPAYFDRALRIGEELSLPVYFRNKAPVTVLPQLPAVLVVSDGEESEIFLAVEGDEITARSDEDAMHTVLLQWNGTAGTYAEPDYLKPFSWPCYQSDGNEGLYQGDEVPDPDEDSDWWWTCVPLASNVYSVVDAYLETDSGEVLRFRPEDGKTFDDYVVQVDPSKPPVSAMTLDDSVPYFHFKHFEGCGWHPDTYSGSVSGTFHVVYEEEEE